MNSNIKDIVKVKTTDLGSGFLRFEIFENFIKVGYADGKIEKADDLNPMFGLDIIYIYPEHRRKGLGTALFKAIEDKLKKINIYSIQGEFIAQDGISRNSLRCFYEELGCKVENGYVEKTF